MRTTVSTFASHQPSRSGLLALVLLVAGCSIFNAPDRSRIDRSDGGPPDGSMDAKLDAPDGDGGGDAGDGGDARDGGDASRPGFELSCENGHDDDEDGATDCADIDCAQSQSCCDDGAELFFGGQDWDDLTRWDAFPNGTSKPETDGSSGRITRFPLLDAPSGIVHSSCVPLTSGARFTLRFHPVSNGGCTAESCDQFASFVLTPVQDAVQGRRILADLAVTLWANGELVISRGGEDLSRRQLTLSPDEAVILDLHVTPGTVRPNEVSLLATISDDGEEAPFVNQREFVLQEQLVGDLFDCVGRPGLFVGVEGRGDAIQVGRLEGTLLQCVNPSQFDEPGTVDDAVVDAADLALGDWASGGVDTVALASTCDGDRCWLGGGGAVRWDTVVSATNVERQWEEFTHVGYSLGHSTNFASWENPGAWMSSGAVKAGHDPPTCLMDPSDCDDAISLRDPGVVPLPDAMGTLPAGNRLAVTYARESPAALAEGQHDLFAIDAQPVNQDSSIGFSPQPMPDLEPGEVGCDPETSDNCCTSLRDPELVPTTPGGPYWLLFVCERDEAAHEIMRVRLGLSLGREEPVESEVVLDSSQLGSIAAAGLRSPEVVVDRTGVSDDGGNASRGPVVRMWFLTRDAQGRPALGLATGQAESEEDLAAAFAELKPYDANPILRADARIFPSCPGECELVSFDVVRRADDLPDEGGQESVRTHRFLFTREVNDEANVRYELIPLEQRWRTQ